VGEEGCCPSAHFSPPGAVLVVLPHFKTRANSVCAFPPRTPLMPTKNRSLSPRRDPKTTLPCIAEGDE
jgi:hypothetical protein